MKNSKDSLDRIREFLSLAHRSKSEDAAPADDSWRQNVMRSIRRIGPIQKGAGYEPDFPSLAWKLAPAALTLMIILGVMISRISDTLDDQLAGLMVSDPVQTYMIYEPL
jgi:hypothetical protein